MREALPIRAFAAAALLLLAASLTAADKPKSAAQPKKQTAAKPAKQSAPSKSRAEGLGIVIGVDAPNLGITPTNDGFQPGVGVIYDFMDNLSLRALAICGVNMNAGAFDLNAGLSAALLWRPVTGRASPYLGALGGASYDAVPESSVLYLYAGGIAGVDLRIIDNLYAFAEYRVIAKNMVNGLTVALEPDANPGMGIIVYF